MANSSEKSPPVPDAGGTVSEDGGHEAKPEAEIKSLWQRGDFNGAVTVLVREYGPEVLGFLVGSSRDHEMALEAYSQLLEDLWTGCAGFRWQCSARTWTYTLARNARARLARRPANRARNNVPLSKNPEIAALVDKARTQTRRYLRTTLKDKWRAVREQLPESDRELLILRVDRGLSWDEVALVTCESDEPLAGAALERRSRALCKQFERLVRRLKKIKRELEPIDEGHSGSTTDIRATPQ